MKKHPFLSRFAVTLLLGAVVSGSALSLSAAAASDASGDASDVSVSEEASSGDAVVITEEVVSTISSSAAAASAAAALSDPILFSEADSLQYSALQATSAGTLTDVTVTKGGIKTKFSEADIENCRLFNNDTYYNEERLAYVVAVTDTDFEMSFTFSGVGTYAGESIDCTVTITSPTFVDCYNETSRYELYSESVAEIYGSTRLIIVPTSFTRTVWMYGIAGAEYNYTFYYTDSGEEADIEYAYYTAQDIEQDHEGIEYVVPLDGYTGYAYVTEDSTVTVGTVNGYSAFYSTTAGTGSENVTLLFKDEINMILGDTAGLIGFTIRLYPEEAIYQVSYDANGGSGSMDSQTMTTDITYTLTKNSFTRTGYLWQNWNTASDGSGTDYADQASVTNLSTTAGDTITMYAQWEPISYTIVYDSNKPSSASGSVSGSMNSTSAVYDTSVTLTKNAYSLTGWTFSGWNTQSDGSGTTYADAASVKNLASADGATVTLYAQWEPITYTIVFDANTPEGASVSGTMADLTLTYDSGTQELTSNAYNIEGYIFTGYWNTSEDGSGTTYTDGQGVSNLTSTDGAVITLYAQWQLETPDVELPDTGGRGTFLFTAGSIALLTVLLAAAALFLHRKNA